METLYISDLDGTLLNEEGFLSSRTLEVMKHLLNKGIKFTYATARSFSSASKVTKGLPLAIPVITYNGAFFVDQKNGTVLHTLSFKEDFIPKMQDFIAGLNLCPFVYARIEGKECVSYLHGRESEGMKRYLEERKNDKRLRPVFRQEELFKGNIFYVTWIDSLHRLMPVTQQLARFSKDSGFTYTFQEEIYQKGEYWLEIMPEGATKADGAKRLMEWTGCRRIVCFGDGINDIPLFQISDYSCAVKNAASDLKKYASEIIGSNREDGVPLWLQDHIKTNSF